MKKEQKRKISTKELFLFCFCLVMWRIKPSFIWHRIVKSQIQVSLQLFLSLYIWKMLFWSWIVAQYSKHQYYFIFKGNSGREMIVCRWKFLAYLVRHLQFVSLFCRWRFVEIWFWHVDSGETTIFFFFTLTFHGKNYLFYMVVDKAVSEFKVFRQGS